VQLNNVDFPMVNPRCTELNLVADKTIGRIMAGKPYQANIVVENGRQEGLAKIELSVENQKNIRWLWIRAGEKKEVSFRDLTAPDAGTYDVRCGDMTQSLRIER
jgi:hypothetical protein